MSQHVTLHLSDDQRAHLEALIRKGSAPARTQTRARILLLCDRSQAERKTDEQVAKAVLCCQRTVGNTRRRFAQEGMDAALSEKPRPGAAPKITGDIEAQLVTLCCSDPPAGRGRWTLRLLADTMVELGYLDSITNVAIGKRLKKTNSSPGR